MFDCSARTRALVIAAVALAASAACLSLDPIPQDPVYHDFADRRAWLGIPNFADVTSNLPFLAVGAYGIAVVVRRKGSPHLKRDEFRAYLLFFCGVGLTAFGSAYYHWAPTTPRLAWDRLPMSAAFMGLLAATVAERVGARAARALLVPLLLLGVFSVAYWSWTEAAGRGDLRLYYLVQFASLLLILAMAVLFPTPYTRSYGLFLSLGIYALAKVCEGRDEHLLRVLGLSGHTLKHLLAALAIFMVARMLATRACKSPGAPAAGPIRTVTA